MFLFGKHHKQESEENNQVTKQPIPFQQESTQDVKPKFSFSKIRNSESNENLAGRVILLNWLNGKSVSAHPIGKFDDDNIFHINWQETKDSLLDDGLLSFAETEDSLPFLGNTDLKDILKSNGQKTSGNKKDLIMRIQENVPSDNYKEKIPKFFNLTDSGGAFLKHNSKVLWADKYGSYYVDENLPEEARIDPISFVKRIGNGKTAEEDAIECYAAAINFHSKEMLFSQVTDDFIGISKIYSLTGDNDSYLYFAVAASLFELSGLSRLYYVNNSDTDDEFFQREMKQALQEAKSFIQNNQYSTKNQLVGAIKKTQIKEDGFAKIVDKVWNKLGKTLLKNTLLRNENDFVNALNKMIN
ncbi:MAG: SAP domain-containing protein [Oenococcus sp.]|uniref:SAP domain-containing protein n=1 Tax=Oenococcus sp. TaxID=1979414 RepID=UPI0039E91E1A